MNSNYDLIAKIYDVDMALNMPFDDVKFYLEQFQGCERVLEVGCGTGRIALPLLDVCHEVVAVDRSSPMLAELNKKLTSYPVQKNSIYSAVMDARHLAVNGVFDRIFFAFSGINYLKDVIDVEQFALGAKAHLAEGGRLVIDAFIPKDIALHVDWTCDYERHLDDGSWLRRFKRIIKNGRYNEIDRRYELCREDKSVLDVIETSSVIHPYTQTELREILQGCGYRIEKEWWDYGQETGSHASFYTMEAVL